MKNLLKLAGEGIKIFGSFISKNSPAILTTLAIGGMGAAIITAIKQPVDVEEELYELEREELHKAAEEETDDIQHPIAPRLKIYAKHYWPTVTLFVTSTAMLVLANKIHAKRAAALMAAYQLTTTNYEDLKKKIVDIYGKKKAQEVQDEVDKDVVQKTFIPNQTIPLGSGPHLILDKPSGRYFYSDIEKVKRAFDDLNRRFYAGESEIQLNELYDDLNLPHIGMGYDNGFIFHSVDDILDWDNVRSSQLTENGIPCLVLHYEVKPLYRGY